MAGLDSLSPNRRTQYDALIPEIERSVREAQNARGGFYSGAAIDAEARAKAELLAKLAGQDAAEQAQASESARDRALTERIRGEEIKAGKRNALLGILGSGVGAAATLGGLAYMNKGGTAGQNLISLGNGQYGVFDPATKSITPIAVGGKAPAALPVAAADDFGAGWGARLPGTAPAPVAAPAAAPSMWKSAAAPKSLGAGALGGGLGYLGARAAGADSTEGAIGSGIGGGLGYLAAARYGAGNPYAAGAGALFGAFGGGLLGNLFK